MLTTMFSDLQERKEMPNSYKITTGSCLRPFVTEEVRPTKMRDVSYFIICSGVNLMPKFH